MVASGSLVVSLAWGLTLSDADQEFARVYPRAAREFLELSGKMNAFYAGEWGFRYYMQRSGVRQLPVDESRVSGGSWLAFPKLALRYNLPEDLATMTVPVQTLTYRVRTPVRILDTQTPAGFYSTGWGLIPFTLSRSFLEELEVRQVDFLIERLPSAKVDYSTGQPPWPGFLAIGNKSRLALFMKPGTRIEFPWTTRVPLILELSCGATPEAYAGGQDRAFEFSVRQNDNGGRVRVSGTVTLNPGARSEDRSWRSVQLPLLPTSKEGDVLELRFDCRDRDPSITGAFAGALLRPAGDT